MDKEFTIFRLQTERQLNHWHLAAQTLRRHELVASSQAWAALEQYVGARIRESHAAACDQLLKDFAVVRAQFNAARSLADLDQVSNGIVAFRSRYTRVEMLVHFYGDAINSRTSPELGAKLRAFDYLAGLSMRRMLDQMKLPTPPVLIYLNKGLGASILRAGLRLWDGGTISPVAAVSVTFHNQERPTAIVHETGHQVAAMLGWNEELTALFARELQREGQDVARVWASWATEVAADAYGFVNVGFAAVAALSDVVGGSPAQAFNYNPAGVHPISYLRVLLGYAMARRFYGRGVWDDLEYAWRMRYALDLAPPALRPLLASLEQAIPRIVELSMLTPMRCFGGRSLADRIDPAMVSPQALLQLERDAGPSLMTSPHWVAKESLRLIGLTGYRFALNPERADELVNTHRTLMQRLGEAITGYRAAA
jgi:hypothetical protein